MEVSAGLLNTSDEKSNEPSIISVVIFGHALKEDKVKIFFIEY
jgi:hypothetical protein